MMPMESSAVKPLDNTWGTLWTESAVLSGSSASSLSEAAGFSLAVQSHLDSGRRSLWLRAAINSSSRPAAWTLAHKFHPYPFLMLPFFSPVQPALLKVNKERPPERRFCWICSYNTRSSTDSQFTDRTDPT